MAESYSARIRTRGKGRKRRQRRIGVRLDMTPMVDVAFLLLTFFMLTTAFRLPQTMEISIPEDEGEKNQVRISESNILQVRVDETNRFYWNMGTEPPHRIDHVQLRSIFVAQSVANIGGGHGATPKDNYKLIVLIKIDRRSKYENMIDVVDQLDLALGDLNRKYGLTDKGLMLSPRFAFAPMTDKDRETLKGAH